MLELGRFGWKANVGDGRGADRRPRSTATSASRLTHPSPIENVPRAPDRVQRRRSNGGYRRSSTEDASRQRSPSTVARWRCRRCPRSSTDPDVRAGAARRSTSFGCASCHTTTFTTGSLTEVGVAALSEQIDPSVHRPPPARHGRGTRRRAAPTGEATGTEWRTPAALGDRDSSRTVNGERRLLHDGRARSDRGGDPVARRRGRGGQGGVPHRRRPRSGPGSIAFLEAL